jgi:hypothetical protein
METTQIAWNTNEYTGLILPVFIKRRAYFRGSDVAWWLEYPNFRDVSMNCARLAKVVDDDFGNTGYSLRNYLIKQGLLTPKQ